MYLPGICTNFGRFGRTGATGRALAARPPGSVRLHVPRCDLALGRTPGPPPVAFMRGADKGTGSNFSWSWGNACSAWSSGPGRAGWERSSDRPLTVGVDVGGRHAAPEARLEWQTMRGRALRGLGMDPCQLLPGCRRDGLSDRRRRRRGQEPDRRLPQPAGRACRAVNPGKCGW